MKSLSFDYELTAKVPITNIHFEIEDEDKYLVFQVEEVWAEYVQAEIIDYVVEKIIRKYFIVMEDDLDVYNSIVYEDEVWVPILDDYWTAEKLEEMAANLTYVKTGEQFKWDC